jgi:hypothetical protein
MNSIRNAGSPSAAFLDEQVPLYRSWFMLWRDIRNRVKYGVGLAVAGTDDDPGIVLVQVERDGRYITDTDQLIRLEDAAAMYSMSAAVTVIAAEGLMKPVSLI